MTSRDPDEIPLSSDEIRSGLQTSALLVQTYGEAYLPYFELLEQELKVALKREAAMNRVTAFLADEKVQQNV